MIIRIIGFLAVLMLTGCSTTYKVQYLTEPRGAVISHQGENISIGISPTVRDYGDSPAYINQNTGCFQVKGVTATWASGAQASSLPILTLCEGPKQYWYRLTRPSNAPGLQKDIEIALQMEQAERLQKQKNDAAWAKIISAAFPKKQKTTGIILLPDNESIIYSETTTNP